MGHYDGRRYLSYLIGAPCVCVITQMLNSTNFENKCFHDMIRNSSVTGCECHRTPNAWEYQSCLCLVQNRFTGRHHIAVKLLSAVVNNKQTNKILNNTYHGLYNIRLNYCMNVVTNLSLSKLTQLAAQGHMLYKVKHYHWKVIF